jgi:ABC-2 type transport system permease protein
MAERLQRILAVMFLESLQVLREPATLSLIFLVPILQVVLFGFAVRPLPGDVSVAVARPAGALARVDQVLQRGALTVVADHLGPGEAEVMARQGLCLLALEYHSGVTVVIVNDLEPLLAQHALSVLATSDSTRPAEPVVVRRLYNPSNRSDWSVVAPLSGLVVMISMLMLGALSLVREREMGTWEPLLTTPLASWEALCGKILPYFILSLLQTVALEICLLYCFDLPIQQHFGPFLVFAQIHALAYLCLGLAISGLAKSQLQAVQGAVLFYIPSILLSGFLLPYGNMPDWAQRIGNLLPFCHYVRASRATLLGGSAPSFLTQEGIPVAIFALLAAALAGWVYRRRL